MTKTWALGPVFVTFKVNSRTKLPSNYLSEDY